MLNIFDNKDITTKEIESNSFDPSPATSQGKNFNEYQKKISESLEDNAEILSENEGFTNFNNMELNANGLTVQTNNIINNNNYSNQQQTINNLRQEYQKTLQQYQNLVSKISGNTTKYIDRVNPNNPYLNKTVKFTTGQICYVTNQGVLKLIPSTNILNSLNIPKKFIDLNIPYLDSYKTPGAVINTTPPLISGTNVVNGQSFGSEGSNVFVDQLLPQNSKPSYMGCFAPNTNNNNMRWIGGAPPSADVSIQNGNFSQPVISNNTYQSINSSSKVPGWVFGNATLLNNSSAWGYPTPYPNGNQCVSLQNKTNINTLVNLRAGVTYTLTYYACGRNCCDGVNPINIVLFTTSNVWVQNISTNIIPQSNKWNIYTVNFTVRVSGRYKLYFSGTNTKGDKSSAIQNISLSGKVTPGGNYTYNQCMNAAIQAGERYFALQNVNTQTSKGYCAVTGSGPGVRQFGESKVPIKMIALWSSNTDGQPGNTAFLDTNGSLQVLNSSGQSVYSSKVKSSEPSNYLGCYGDRTQRRMPTWLGRGKTYETCQSDATKKGLKYFGLQFVQPNGTSECWGGNDLSKATASGKSSNCRTLNGVIVGGGSTNAIYDNSKAASNYYLILQDNGNMVIYRGTGPSNNQGEIWATKTSGKQLDANPAVEASKGKYGQNWMPSNGTLAPGDFIGSTDGKFALVMETNGNLVLYAYQMGTNCQKMSDGNMGGGLLGNAAYDIGKIATPSNMGKLAYIDGNAELHEYPSSNQVYSNTYTVINDANTPQGNINGAAYSGATLGSCQKSCNKNPSCAGFTFSGNTCYPKNNTMYPYGGTIINANGVNTYIRNKIPASPPIGVSLNTSNIDTIKYRSYKNGGKIDSKYGLANINSVEKQQLEQLQTKMNLLSGQISNLTGKFGRGATMADNQGEKNNSGINDYVKGIKNTNVKIKNVADLTTGGLQNILKDSDIVVLQKNYDYLFWSILATATVLVSMNIAKKQ